MNSSLHGLTLVAGVSAWLAGIYLNSLFLFPMPAILIAAILTSIYLIFQSKNKRTRLMIIFMLCTLAGSYRYTLSQPENDPVAVTHFINNSTYIIQGDVTNQPALEGRSRVYLVQVTTISSDRGNTWSNAHGIVEIETKGTAINDDYGASYGDSVEITGKLLHAQTNGPSNIFAVMAFPKIQIENSGGFFLLTWLYALRTGCELTISRLLPQPEAALLIAILLGLRTPALGTLLFSFNVTGVAHLIAPSGFKVTILAGLVTRIARGRNTYTRKESFTPRSTSRWRKWIEWNTTILTMLFIGAYTILSGDGAAALRAGIMGGLLIIAPRLQRTYNVYTALAFTALVLSCANPFVLWDVGFQLSFLGTLGIILFTPYLQWLCQPLARLPWIGHELTEIIAVTLAAECATAPIFASAFQQISFIAPLTNLLTVPLLATILIQGILLCGIGHISLTLATPLSWFTWTLLWYIIHSVQWSASLPGAYITLHTTSAQLDDLSWIYYLCISISAGLLLWKWPSNNLSSNKDQEIPHAHIAPRARHMIHIGIALMVITAIALAIQLYPADRTLTITFLDLVPTNQPPQGESVLIHTPGNKIILIDGGLDPTALAMTLDSRLPPWQRSLDLVILTSPRSDHIGGLQDVITRYTIRQVLDAGMLHPTTTYVQWRRTISEQNISYQVVRQGESIPIENQILLQVLEPAHPLHKGSNEIEDNGLVLRLIAPDFRLLLLGSAAQSHYALENLLTTFTPSTLHAEVVQLSSGKEQATDSALTTVLSETHSTLIVMTPSALSHTKSNAQTNEGNADIQISLPIGSRLIQTAQVGSLQIKSDKAGWISNTS